MTDRDKEILDWIVLAKGDTPGHEFHGNQYTDGGAAAARALDAARRANDAANDGDMEGAFRAHVEAAQAHRDASDAALGNGDRVTHRVAAERHDYAASATASGKRPEVVRAISDFALRQTVSASPEEAKNIGDAGVAAARTRSLATGSSSYPPGTDMTGKITDTAKMASIDREIEVAKSALSSVENERDRASQPALALIPDKARVTADVQMARGRPLTQTVGFMANGKRLPFDGAAAVSALRAGAFELSATNQKKFDSIDAKVKDVDARRDAARKALAEAESKYQGWHRYYGVPDGHIHNTDRCHTFDKGRYQTTVIPLTSLSGKPLDEALKSEGPTLCTHCFPDAPVEQTRGKWNQSTAAPGELGPSARLAGQDLRDRDFTGQKGNKANLSGANLSGANLTKTNLRGADLTGADLTGVKMNEKTSLWSAKLKEANLSGVTTSGKFESADLSGANLSGARVAGNFESATLDGADLTGAKVTANLAGASVTGANLDGADLSGISRNKTLIDEIVGTPSALPNGTLIVDGTLIGGGMVAHGLDLKGLDMSKVGVTNGSFQGCDMSGADLSGRQISSDMRGAKLASADLSGSTVSGSLASADLRGANLSGATLYRTQAGDANLSGANLSGAKLVETNFFSADLRNANLEGASFQLVSRYSSESFLSGANLEGANLRGVTGLTDRSVNYGSNFAATTGKPSALPDGWTWDDEKGMVPPQVTAA